MKKLLIFLVFIIIEITAYSQSLQNKFENEKCIFEFNICDSTYFPDYFEDQDKIDSISKCYDNRHREALAVEKYQLNKYHLPIKIEGNNRIVSLQNNNKINLIPNDTFGEAEYTFEKRFGIYYLFRIQWFEGNNYCLLNSKTGQKTFTIGRVYFSKSGKYLISINDDIEAGYSENGFQLFQIDKTGDVNEVCRFSPDWAPEKIKWIDDKTLMVKGYYISSGKDYFEIKTLFKEIKIKN